ncbi:fibronectin type III domain-containing protein [Mucilaginibacter polytrichastri]|uniref:Fibronectin type-III domain-containing protein n=1 Tax=Mucilaginibacter polytrichastri TaxID=1302689 RepID=A0A1Q5ZZU0_9SPHI|nr:hypothetical protein [Mucilaginibacter polytrichastri]OKS87285.1 hypothetical protein RG47T_2744 [Mucilaginibacter polytrichastri]SFT18517.1 hypothetical protein SAMN04487890_11516 [Mucilaginibacter polytrichastri]
MNSKVVFILLLLSVGVSLTLSSCKDLIEPDISNRQVVAEAPGDKLQTQNYSMNFWWDDLEDALQYRLQVVSPKFDSIPSLVLDTIIKGTKFSINLSPGYYQWHVRAENGSSKTAYSQAKSFTILQSSIKLQKVQLSTPANNFLTNQNSLSFSWSPLYGATQYHLEIDTANFADEKSIYYDKTISGQQINVTLSKDQVYQWRVMAINDTAQAQWSAINTFTYDRTPPAAVKQIAPGDKTTLNNPVSLQWNTVSTAVKYKLYVYKADGTTPYSSSFPMLLTATSYNFTTGSSGDTVYWKVTAIDAVGNEGPASDTRSFMIQ